MSKLNYDGIEKITNFAAQYKEELIENEICFNRLYCRNYELKAIMVILSMMRRSKQNIKMSLKF
jgi:hypothetical protein